MNPQLAFPMFDSAEEATNAAIVRSGREFKEVAHAVFPALAQATAYARLKAALNPDKPEKLTADEHLLVANFVGQFDFLYHAAAQCSHSQPTPVSPQDRQATLMTEFNRRVEDLKKIASQIRPETSLRAVA